nr:MAG TPA: hypothetical protein [Caudoviricetes sp.]
MIEQNCRPSQAAAEPACNHKRRDILQART